MYNCRLVVHAGDANRQVAEKNVQQHEKSFRIPRHLSSKLLYSICKRCRKDFIAFTDRPYSGPSAFCISFEVSPSRSRAAPIEFTCRKPTVEKNFGAFDFPATSSVLYTPVNVLPTAFPFDQSLDLGTIRISYHLGSSKICFLSDLCLEISWFPRIYVAGGRAGFRGAYIASWFSQRTEAIR